MLRQREIARRRLANQRLIGATFGSPLEAVRTLGAVQSQDYAGGKWGIGQRLADAVDADVERPLREGTIVRIHVLRPTWHFVAAGDIRWMLALTAPRLRATMAPYDRKLELDDAVFARSAAVIERELAGGTHLTRAELGQALLRENIDRGVGQRLAHLMMRAELDGLICSGVRKGNQSTYALLEERVPPVPSIPRDEAMHELAMRYFRTRGPATVHDFSWWSGLTMGDARRAVELAASSLAHETMNGGAYWFTTDAPALVPAGSSAHLLPNYDEYFIGFRDRSALQGRAAASNVTIPAEAFLANIIVIDGELVGGWKRVVVGPTTIVVLRLAIDIPRRAISQVHAQVKRYAGFLGNPLEVEIVPPKSRGKRVDRRRPK